MPIPKHGPVSKQSPARRVFKYKTDESQIHLIRYCGKSRVIRPIGFKTWAQGNFLRHSIFHTLYPENSIKPVGISRIKITNGDGKSQKLWGMVSEILRGRSPEYKAFHKWFYTSGKKLDLEADISNEGHKIEPAGKHIDFALTQGGPTAWRIYQESGIELSKHPANIVNVNGKPVFIEVPFIRHRILKNAVSTLPDGKKKVKLEKLMGKLSKMGGLPDF